eukprot:c438_g1_i1.p1 GENE.c438_g1_i1~~c438_g1_i1.p1  ORF type:complete len:381 (+),score=63.94 c438_g1_i1:44-1186(+)
MLKKRFLADLEKEQNPKGTCKHEKHSPSPSEFKRSRPDVVVVQKAQQCQPTSEVDNGIDADDQIPQFNESGEQLYCVCRKPYNSKMFMIGCDECDGWFHGRCVGIGPSKANSLAKYVCPFCMKRKAKRMLAMQARQLAEPKVEQPQVPVVQTLRRTPSEEGSDDSAIVPASAERDPASPDSASVIPSPPRDEILDSPKSLAVAPLVLDPAAVSKVCDSKIFCANSECDLPASPSSKFCGQDCAVSAAKANLKRRKELFASPKLPPSTIDAPQLTSAVNVNEEIKEILSKQCEVTRNIELLEKRKAILVEAIKRKQDNPESADCGCPLTEGGWCGNPASSCFQHIHWQSVRKSSIISEQISQDTILKRLKEEEAALRVRLS